MRLIAAAAIAFAMTIGSAQAQPAPWQPDRQTAGWVFTPTLGLGGLWDSNVTIRNENDPDTVSELIGIVNPRGEIDYNGRRTRFNAGYSGALEAYRDVSELNRYEQRGRMSLRHTPSARTRLEGRASYTASPTTDRLELGTVPFVDIGGRSFDLVGAMAFQANRRTGLELEYQFQQVDFDRDDAISRPDLLEGGYAHSPIVRVTHALTSRLAAGGEWQYRRASVADGARTFNVQMALGQLAYQLGPHTTLEGGAGVSYLDVSQTGISAWGPALRAGLEHSFERTRVWVRYNRAFIPSFSFGGLTGNQDFSAGVTAPFGANRYLASASVGYSSSDPVKELGVGFGLDSLFVNGSLGYQVAPWLRSEGFVSVMHQTSTVRGVFDRTRIGIQFVTFKPVRIQ